MSSAKHVNLRENWSNGVIHVPESRSPQQLSETVFGQHGRILLLVSCGRRGRRAYAAEKRGQMNARVRALALTVKQMFLLRNVQMTLSMYPKIA